MKQKATSPKMDFQELADDIANKVCRIRGHSYILLGLPQILDGVFTQYALCEHCGVGLTAPLRGATPHQS